MKKGSDPAGSKGKDALASLNIDMPDPRESMRLLNILFKQHTDYEKEMDAAAKYKDAHIKENEQKKPLHIDSETATFEARLKALEEDANLGMRVEDFMEGEQVLYPAHPEDPVLDLTDDSFSTVAREAQAALGLPAAAAGLAEADSPGGFEGAAFRQAVLAGLIASRASEEGACSAATIEALFQLTAFSPDLEVAGAAFETLLAIMGDAGDPCIRLDVGPRRRVAPKSIKLTKIPSISAIFKALTANGYDPKRAGKINGKGKKAEVAAVAQAVAAADEQQAIHQDLRTQSLKLLFHITAAVCRFCGLHQEFSAAAIDRDAVGDLLQAVIHLGLDPSALRLRPDLDCATVGLLRVLDEDDWDKKLPQIADRIVAMAPSPIACLRMLRQIPSNWEMHPRGVQLRQFAGCILLGKIIPGKAGPALKRGEFPSPVAVVQAQPWFTNPKALVLDAVTAVALKRSRGAGYTISDVEVLLKVCDLVLWPQALAAWSTGYSTTQCTTPADTGGSLEPLDEDFVRSWKTFLAGIYRNIKALQPEDQAVRAYASRMEISYSEMISS